MRCLLQRVTRAKVTVDGKTVGEIGKGYLALVGIAPDDSTDTVDAICRKMLALRIFEDENGRMNKSVTDIGGEVLAVSQFTLYADCRHGNRPSFTDACEPVKAHELYRCFCEKVAQSGVKTECGIFGADMQVELVNDGPVTVMLDSDVLIRR